MAKLCYTVKKERKEGKNKGVKDVEATKSLRRRVNVSRGMKGGVSFEATVDGENYTQEEILKELDALVEALEKRYPPTGV